MFVGAKHPRDAAYLNGSETVLEIGSGIPGDPGTASVVLSCVRTVGSLEPGLRTMLDVPLRPPTALPTRR